MKRLLAIRSRWLGAVAGGVLIALVAASDYVTGPELYLSLFYLLPVAVSTWLGGRAVGFAISVVSAIALLLANVAGTTQTWHSFVPDWNAMIALGFFVIVTLLLSATRGERERLEHAVQQRTLALTAEIRERKRVEERLRTANQDLLDRENELLRTLAELERSHAQLKTTQFQLIEAEKLEAIGRLAAGVAHEVKNPLAIIRAGVDYLATGPARSDDATPSVVRRMGEAVARADCVVSEMLDLSAPHELELAVEDLNDLIDQACVLVKHELARRPIRLNTELSPDLPQLWLDRVKIKQVFINLLTNAIHAMPDGGTLTVRTRASTLAEAGIDHRKGARRSDELTPEQRVVVAEVEDTGVGIPEESLPHVFDPFFSTKDPAQGTGLGLTVTKQIVDLHGGVIEIRNRREGGVSVLVAFKG
jgi:two-component system NtrC family sensor kinase